jgi:PKD repeat protein
MKSNYYLFAVVSGMLFMASCRTEPPVPCFEYAVTNSYANEVVFKNCSELGESYEWDFGDGSTSSEFEPLHNFPGPGSYQVKLVVEGEKESAELTKEVEVLSPLWIKGESATTSTDYKEKMIIKIVGFGQNKIKHIQVTQLTGKQPYTHLDTILKLEPLHVEFDLTIYPRMAYRDETRFRFDVTDGFGQTAQSFITVASGNTVDTTVGKVYVKMRDKKDSFKFEYSHATGTYFRSNGKFNLELYGKDGSYIFIKDGSTDYGHAYGYSVEVYDAKTKTTQTKEASRMAAGDKLYMEEYDNGKMAVSGLLEMDFNLETAFHDVMQMTFEEINLTDKKYK